MISRLTKILTLQPLSDGIARHLAEGTLELSHQVPLVAEGLVQRFVRHLRLGRGRLGLGLGGGYAATEQHRADREDRQQKPRRQLIAVDRGAAASFLLLLLVARHLGGDLDWIGLREEGHDVRKIARVLGLSYDINCTKNQPDFVFADLLTITTFFVVEILNLGIELWSVKI